MTPVWAEVQWCQLWSRSCDSPWQLVQNNFMALEHSWALLQSCFRNWGLTSGSPRLPWCMKTPISRLISRLLFHVLRVFPLHRYLLSKEIQCFSWNSVRTASDDAWRTKSSSTGTLLLLEPGSKIKTSSSYQTTVRQESSSIFATMVIERFKDLHPANSK